jgi:8-oxo-dGTP pyrophosphatase MutT (NUDIX family)
MTSPVRRLRERLKSRQRTVVDNPSSRRAAVLVTLIGREEAPQLVYFERSDEVIDHKGEICFPGGSFEAHDDGPVAAALREANEELGLPPDQVQVIGLLDDVETHVSNFVITPVVGFIDGMPELVADPLEVGRVITVPFARLFDPGVEATLLRDHEGVSRVMYSYTFDGNRVWGATGRITHALVETLREDHR